MALDQNNPSQPSDEISQALGDLNSSNGIPGLPDPQIDPRATSENEKDPYTENEKIRGDKLKDVFHWVVVWGIRVAFFIFLIVFLIRVSHLVLPHCWRWLADDDIQGIDKLFFSGTIGGVVGRYIKVVIPNK